MQKRLERLEKQIQAMDLGQIESAEENLSDLGIVQPDPSYATDAERVAWYVKLIAMVEAGRS